jgi:dihydrofolate reductase
MKVTLIAAVARNGTIGRDNRVPWDIKSDLAHFKAETMGKTIVMGRKTWHSLGRPLPGRKNVVLSRDPALQKHLGSELREGHAAVFHTIDEVLAACADEHEVMVIGGEGIYRLFLPVARYQILTELSIDVPGDTFYPEYYADQWSCIREVPSGAGEPIPYVIRTYERVMSSMEEWPEESAA